MAANFRNAVSAAGISITTNRNGSRRVGGNAHMDGEDDNQYRNQNNYRGSWRGRGRGGRGRGRYNYHRSGVTPTSRFADDDGDESMGEQFRQRPRYTPYGSRGNYSRGGYNSNRFDNKTTDSSWFKITIPGGRQHDKNWLMTKLKGQVTLPFECVEFHFVGDSACFFVEDKEVADALRSKSHKITVRDGSKIVIHTRPSAPPRQHKGGNMDAPQNAPPSKPVDPETKKVLLNCLAQRFIKESNSINLSRLLEDPILSSNNIQPNLNKPWLMSAFLDLIHNIQPELSGLDLSSNRLRNLDILRYTHEKLLNLKVISLKDNEIQSVDELEKLKSINSLTHLLVEGNPLCLKYQNSLESLRRDVQRKLSSLEMLDGTKLPPPISFDLPKAASLPPPQENYAPLKPDTQQKITQFVSEYFRLYDQDDRQGLLELYHDQASFSLSVNTNVFSKDYGRERQQPLNEYFQFSRNLKRLRDRAKRSTLIKHTKLSTVAFLNELPKSKHDLSSFAVDVVIETSKFVCFIIRGHFSEGETRDTPRAFSRTFLLLLSPSIKIMNDQLHIRNPIKEIIQGTPTDTSTSTAVRPPESVALSSEQQELVKKFSEASKMNWDFSLKCLQLNNWDFLKSGQDFTRLQQQGGIPPEAFKR